MAKSESLHVRILLAPLVFLALGPTLPVLYWAKDGVAFPAALFFALLYAPAVGGLPAVIAGFAYSGLSYFVGKVLRGKDLNIQTSLFLGTISGALGMMSFQLIVSGAAFPTTSSLKGLFMLGVGVGACCATVLSGVVALLAQKPKSTFLQSGIRRTAVISAQGKLVGDHGTCPSCEAVIPMSIPECSRCKAQFGSQAVWMPSALSEAQIVDIEAAITSSPQGNQA